MAASNSRTPSLAPHLPPVDSKLANTSGSQGAEAQQRLVAIWSVQEQAALDNFAYGESRRVLLYRGVHFLQAPKEGPDVLTFPDDLAEEKPTAHTTSVPARAQDGGRAYAVYPMAMAGVSGAYLFQDETPENLALLAQYSDELRFTLEQKLEVGPVDAYFRRNTESEPALSYLNEVMLLHQRFSNSMQSYQDDFEAAKAGSLSASCRKRLNLARQESARRTVASLFSGLEVKESPFLPTSTKPHHAAAYALGYKASPYLTDDRRRDRHPKGTVLVFAVPANLLSLESFTIMQELTDDGLAASAPRIGHEGEVTFFGHLDFLIGNVYLPEKSEGLSKDVQKKHMATAAEKLGQAYLSQHHLVVGDLNGDLMPRGGKFERSPSTTPRTDERVQRVLKGHTLFWRQRWRWRPFFADVGDIADLSTGATECDPDDEDGFDAALLSMVSEGEDSGCSPISWTVGGVHVVFFAARYDDDDVDSAASGEAEAEMALFDPCVFIDHAYTLAFIRSDVFAAIDELCIRISRLVEVRVVQGRFKDVQQAIHRVAVHESLQTAEDELLVGPSTLDGS